MKNTNNRAFYEEATGAEMIYAPITFRDLKADEIECRAQYFNDKFKPTTVKITLYKTARADMNILDETVGNTQWERLHQEIKGVLYCGIGIHMQDGTIVWKWDCGKESNTEAQKGEASDAFKRAGFCWGIGRKLYTTPTISISLNEKDFYNDKLCQSFSVKEIQYTDNKISYLSIVDKWDKVRFTYGEKKPYMTDAQQTSAIKRLASGENIWQKLRETYTIDENELKKRIQSYIDSWQ